MCSKCCCCCCCCCSCFAAADKTDEDEDAAAAAGGDNDDGLTSTRAHVVACAQAHVIYCVARRPVGFPRHTLRAVNRNAHCGSVREQRAPQYSTIQPSACRQRQQKRRTAVSRPRCHCQSRQREQLARARVCVAVAAIASGRDVTSANWDRNLNPCLLKCCRRVKAACVSALLPQPLVAV